MFQNFQNVSKNLQREENRDIRIRITLRLKQMHLLA